VFCPPTTTGSGLVTAFQTTGARRLVAFSTTAFHGLIGQASIKVDPARDRLNGSVGTDA
jgi:hypothetical protein